MCSIGCRHKDICRIIITHYSFPTNNCRCRRSAVDVNARQYLQRRPDSARTEYSSTRSIVFEGGLGLVLPFCSIPLAPVPRSTPSYSHKCVPFSHEFVYSTSILRTAPVLIFPYGLSIQRYVLCVMITTKTIA